MTRKELFELPSIDFGNDERVVCMENNKLKIFKLIEETK